ncbi:MAG: polysaccharide biosynthesis/export family protein [Luteimonas sp.]
MRRMLTLLLAVLLAGCASGAGVRPGDTGRPLPEPDRSSAATFEGVGDYRLGAQDLIEVSVFGVDDLTKSVRVNANGQVSLPLVGAVMAGGRTISELESDLEARYGNGYLQRPQITVSVKEFSSQRITVEGAVREPGIYPMTGQTSLVQAIAVSGGLDPLADLGGIVLFRVIDGRKMAAVYNMRELRSGRIDDPQLHGGDIVIVEQSGSKTALRRFIETIPAVALFLAF